MKGGTLYCTSIYSPSAPAGPAAGEITSPPPSLSLCLAQIAVLDLTLYASLFELRSKENMKTNKSVSGISPVQLKGPHLAVVHDYCSCDGKHHTQEVAYLVEDLAGILS